MILILSRDRNEMSTEEVIGWVDALGGKYTRLNGEDLESENSYAIEISERNCGFSFNGSDLNFSANDINVVWYRRWYKGQKLNSLEELDALLFHKMSGHLKNELTHTSHAMFKML